MGDIEKMTDFTNRAKEIISRIIYITIATVSKEGEPWNAPVFAAYDKDYNFYWALIAIAKSPKT